MTSFKFIIIGVVLASMAQVSVTKWSNGGTQGAGFGAPPNFNAWGNHSGNGSHFGHHGHGPCGHMKMKMHHLITMIEEAVKAGTPLDVLSYAAKQIAAPPPMPGQSQENSPNESPEMESNPKFQELSCNTAVALNFVQLQADPIAYTINSTTSDKMMEKMSGNDANVKATIIECNADINKKLATANSAETCGKALLEGKTLESCKKMHDAMHQKWMNAMNHTQSFNLPNGGFTGNVGIAVNTQAATQAPQ